MKLVKTAFTPPIMAISVVISAALGAQAAVPEGYAELKYIESTGTQWIDTMVVPLSTTRVVLDFALTEKPTSTATCGWGSSGGAEAFMFGASASGFYTCIDPAWKNSSYATDSAGASIPLDLARHTFDVKSGSQKFDGVEYAKWTIGNTASANQNLYLFATHVEWGTVDYKMKMKIYSCKIYDGETLVRDFVPVLDANGKPGLLDIAQGHNLFYPNKATSGDDFTPGPIADGIMVKGHPLDYGEPSPGYGAKHNVEVGMDYTFTMPQGVCTNATKTEVYTCTGWTLVDNEGVGTSGPELTKTVNFAGGSYTLTWNWAVKRGYFGRTLAVPSQHATIAAAVEAAEDGDTIVVADGTYEIADQIEVTKAIALKSANGVDVTRVVRPNGHGVTDRSQAVTVATGARRVLYINNPEARVEGIAFCGGAVWNVANEYGGGVLIGADGGTLANCTVTNNFCRKPSYGGGIAVTGAAGLVTNCLVSSNYNYRWQAIDDFGRGAGVYLTDGNVVDSTLTGNGTYAVYGAGAYLTGGRMSRCRITGNKAGGGNFKFAGGVYLDGASALVDNCLIAANTSAGDGGGAYVNVGTLANCTVVGNTGAAGGGVWASANAKLYNCILSDNKVTADTGAGAPEWCGASATYRYCLSPVAFPSGSTGCRKADDPRFADAAGGDYSLLPESDAIDAGLADVPDVTQTLDLARANRFCNQIDIGCYEYQYSGVLLSITQSGDDQTTRAAMTLTVKAKVETADALAYRWNFGDGWSDWSESNTCSHRFGTTGEQSFSVQVRVGLEELAVSAGKAFVYPEKIRVELDGSGDFEDVPSALAVAGNGTVVQVGAGQFDFGGMLSIDKAIRLEGAGAERTVLHRTDGSGVRGQANRVLSINNDKAVVSGVAVTGGYVYGATGEYGGGVQIGTKGGLLCDSIVSNNNCQTSSYGAGVALVGETAVVSNCLIVSNVGKRVNATDGETAGGGVYLGNGLVTHCIITNNGCGGNGAGAYVAGGRLTHTRVVRNKVNATNNGNGSGLYVKSGARVDNVLVISNDMANSQGTCKGAVCLNGGTLLNATVVGNTKAKGGAGIYTDNGGGTIVNAVIEGNTLLSSAAAQTTTNWLAAGGATYSHSMCPEALPAGDGNVQASAVYADPERYVLKARTAGWKAGTTVGYESTLVGGTDLWDAPRVRRQTRKGVALVDVGCAESDWMGNGFGVIVR